VWTPKDGKRLGLMPAGHNYLHRSVLCKSQSNQVGKLHSNCSNDNQRTGALSDGLHWTIWHNYDGWYFANFKTQSMEDAFTLLSNTNFIYSFANY